MTTNSPRSPLPTARETRCSDPTSGGWGGCRPKPAEREFVLALKRNSIRVAASHPRCSWICSGALHRHRRHPPARRGFQPAAGIRQRSRGARRSFAYFALTVVPAGRDITDYSDAGETLDAALSPWRLQMGHPSFQGPSDATVPYGRARPSISDTYASLQTVKANYDPNNNFRVNHNIPPMSPV
jgi:hypothetical protein